MPRRCGRKSCTALPVLVAERGCLREVVARRHGCRRNPSRDAHLRVRPDLSPSPPLVADRPVSPTSMPREPERSARSLCRERADDAAERSLSHLGRPLGFNGKNPSACLTRTSHSAQLRAPLSRIAGTVPSPAVRTAGPREQQGKLCRAENCGNHQEHRGARSTPRCDRIGRRAARGEHF